MSDLFWIAALCFSFGLFGCVSLAAGMAAYRAWAELPPGTPLSVAALGYEDNGSTVERLATSGPRTIPAVTRLLSLVDELIVTGPKGNWCPERARKAALEVLVRMGGSEAAGVIAKSLQRRPGHRVKIAAIQRLGQPALEPLRQAVLVGANPELAAEALVGIAGPATAPFLWEVLNRRYRHLNRCAFGSQQAALEIADADSEYLAERRAYHCILNLLARLGDVRVVPLLVPGLGEFQHRTASSLRLQSIDALIRLQHQHVVTNFDSVLQGDAVAIAFFASHHRLPAIASLLRLIGRAEEGSQLNAIRALLFLSAKEAVPSLRELGRPGNLPFLIEREIQQTLRQLYPYSDLPRAIGEPLFGDLPVPVDSNHTSADTLPRFAHNEQPTSTDSVSP